MPRMPLLLLLLFALLPGPAGADAMPDYRAWVDEMKTAPRGPFRRLRWFCNDGSVHPPRPYPCEERGGGYQHGEWNERTQELRAQGYRIANILAGIDPAAFVAQPDFRDIYAQLLIEQYLIDADDGWILRRARFYRGGLQEEDERAGGRELLTYLAGQPEWYTTRYPALRTGVRLLPHGQQTASVHHVRGESAALAEVDPGFDSLRAKIHGAPAASDAERVREYAAGVSDAGLRARYESLAALIDSIYRTGHLVETLEAEAAVFSRGPWLQAILRRGAAELRADDSSANRYHVTAALLAELRDALDRINMPSARLRVLDLGLEVEEENFRASAELRERLDELTRGQRLELLAAGIDAAYGTGLLRPREHAALKQSLAELAASEVALARYLEELRYLGRVPGWGAQNLRFFFAEAMQKLAEIEPAARLFIQDQLRGSPLLFYSQVLDGLAQDANRLAGVRHRLFGAAVGSGLHALNPGLAAGTLHSRPDARQAGDYDAGGIYLLPETVADLPPVAGILTAGAGNPLSHVQLLARNLGIPNVAVDEALLGTLRAHDGEQVVLAVSPAGLVELTHQETDRAGETGAPAGAGGVVIRPDLEKLDLSEQAFLDLGELRAADSGRTVGPKAAKLGELQHLFPAAVAPGLAIPFGAFKAEVLDRPYRGGPRSVQDWMVDSYRALEALPAGSPERARRTEDFRAELYGLILGATPSAAFRERLRAAMVATFGSADAGVFIRSDTNVEDLPGFTGAGLNLTLPNVAGFDNLLAGIQRVWASPFTARAFAWRQSHMESPEHVYTSILLLQSVPADKSGVLVTQDLETGDRAVLSVAVNEGVGGAVDGQAAESLRIDTRDGSVRLLATASAPWQRRPAAGGGIEKLPASGADRVLEPAEVERLIRFAKIELPARFPALTDDAGNPAAADVEFGFVDGELRLFQIRPFLENRSARDNARLVQMDAALADSLERSVRLDEVPGT